MRNTRAVKITLSVAAGVAVAAAAAGVTYAATSTTTKVVYACANRSGTLKLLSKGRCPTGYGKVAINEQGPRGLTGPRGGTGPRGAQGVPGPGAVTVYASSDTSASAVQDRPIPGLGLTVTTVCSVQAGAQSAVYLTDTTASADYQVNGSYYLAATGGHAYLVHTGATPSPNLTEGLGPIEYAQTTELNTSSEFVVQYDSGAGGQMTADITVTRGGKHLVVHLYVLQTATHCVAQAVATPAS